MKPIHILLVEDNEGDILLTTDAFADYKTKTTVSVVKNGKLALEYMFKKGEFQTAVRPDIVILDINLPFKNGLEVLEIIKSDESMKFIPTIMFTTSSSKSDILKAYANHANAFITKPIDVADFLNAILSIEIFWLNIIQLPNK